MGDRLGRAKSEQATAESGGACRPQSMKLEYRFRDTVRARSQTAPQFLPTRVPALPHVPVSDCLRVDLKPREKRAHVKFWRSFPQLPAPKLFALANRRKSSLPIGLPPRPPRQVPA